MPQQTEFTEFVALIDIDESNAQNVQEMASIWGDVRREFERFRREQAEARRAAGRSRALAYDEEGPVRIVEVTPRIAGDRGETASPGAPESGVGSRKRAGDEAGPESEARGGPRPAQAPGTEGGPDDEGVVVFRPGMTMEDMEREAIAAALEEVDGNRRQAAEMLGIGERTLYRKLRKYDLGDG